MENLDTQDIRKAIADPQKSRIHGRWQVGGDCFPLCALNLYYRGLHITIWENAFAHLFLQAGALEITKGYQEERMSHTD